MSDRKNSSEGKFCQSGAFERLYQTVARRYTQNDSRTEQESIKNCENRKDEYYTLSYADSNSGKEVKMTTLRIFFYTRTRYREEI
ncbi:hypothetical protein [Pseudanabaena sp. PCC 6802]|uniref:hypothetical protein n=1 Tax=Pseudanabaena sp. PCC 6802 TaxID=118173 RepID=UPI000349D7AD|nr:hypothetical protein [Pseudanabaena sp. PCC 6802]